MRPKFRHGPGRSKSEWRAAVLAVALFAISINFLQPLAHAALVRHGGPVATLLWKSMCVAEVPDDRDLPQHNQTTRRCLGLACPAALPTVAMAFALVQYTLDIDRPLPSSRSMRLRRSASATDRLNPTAHP